MGCGPGIGGALMDDLIYPRLWLVDNEKDKKNKDTEESDHDIRKLFPKKDGKKTTSIGKVSKKGTPEWLAMSVGVFFVGALFTIASYQVYSGNFSDELSHVRIQNDVPEIFADAPEAEYNDIKLPKDIVPLSYKLYLNISVAKKLCNGIITIEFRCKHATNKIILHSVRHTINSDKIILRKDKKRIPVKNHFRNKVTEMLILSLNESLVPGNTYNLLLGFNNVLDGSVSHGIYLTKYKDGNGADRHMVSQDLEPTKARYVFPCFDEPALKATWKIMIRAEDPGFHALSNMPVEKTVKLPDGTNETFFETTPVMSSYLVSFAVTEYGYRKGVSGKGVPVRVFGPTGRLNETTKALEYALFAVDYFADAFGINYTLPKLDLFPVTKFSASADESWGNIVFMESSLLLDPKKSSQYSFKYTCQVVAHEIAHQWFGDLVTMKWWNDLWLKESFATYLENFPVQELYPSWDTRKTSFESTMKGLSYDTSKYTHPVATNETDPKKLENSYDSITYEKGGSVVNMLASYIGKQQFFDGLKIYLNRYALSSASEIQLWAALSQTDKPDKVDVPGIMYTWVSFAGFPLITVHRDGNKLVFEQERFFNKDGKNQSDSTIWMVPIHVKICGKYYRYLLTRKQGVGQFAVDSDCDPTEAYKVNYGSSGYFHVNYADKNWVALLKLLRNDHLELPAIDRTGLLFDVYSLARFNHLNVELALNFTEFLDNEHDPQVWRNGLNLLNLVRHVFYDDTEVKSCVEEYVKAKMGPVLKDLELLTHHNHDQISLIQLLMNYAINYNMRPLTYILENKFLKWIVNDGSLALPVNERYQIIRAGVRFGDVPEFDYVNKTRMNAQSIQERHALLNAMTFTKDPIILRRILDEAVAKMNGRGLEYVCSNRIARPMAIEAIQNNWDALKARFKVDSGLLHYILSSCFNPGKTEKELKQAQRFLDNYDLGRWRVYVERSIERIEQNIAFKRHKEDVENWCRQHKIIPVNHTLISR